MSLRLLSKEEFILPGTAACPGCAEVLALRLALKALGKNMILVVPAGCTAVIQGMAPHTSFNVPVLNFAFAAGGAAASGVVDGLAARGISDVTVAVWAGDGGTGDIGLQALSGAAERQTDMIFFCCDNESYMNTGIQRSSLTPFAAWSTTTPVGKKERKKDMPMIMAAHHVPYVATACASYPMDLVERIEAAKKFSGTKYIQILVPCPTGWRYSPEKTIEIGRYAVETGIWPLYTIQEGIFSLSPLSERLLDDSKRRPVSEYLESQGRFRNLDQTKINQIQQSTISMWEYLSRINGTTIFFQG